ncbi:TPA: hypothetical protein ACNVDX_003661 [Citrobacter gillenii]
MIQHKKYLAGQVWCTPLANWLLVKICAYAGLPPDFNAFIPGLAVAVAHFFLLALTFINVPSIEDVRFNVDIRKSRKRLENLKGESNLTPEQQQEIDGALSIIRSKQIAKCLRDVEHSMAVHESSLQGDAERSQ